MLVLSRKVGQKIVIGNSVELEITSISRNRVRVGIRAPGETRILRGELSVDSLGFGDATDAEPAAPACC